MTETENSSSFPTLLGSFETLQGHGLARFCRLATLALVLTFCGVSTHATDFDPSPSALDGAPELFFPRATKRATLANQIEAGRQPIQFNRKLAKLSLGSEARLSLPLGVSYVLNFDNRFDHPSGNVTWVGSLEGYGDDYRAVITFGEGGVSGRVYTPDGEFLVETDADGEWLIDPQAAGLAPEGPGSNDALIPLPEEVHRQLSPGNPGASARDNGGAISGGSPIKGEFLFPFDGLDPRKDLVVTAANTTPVTIDVMILYTPGLANRLGSGLSARLDQLVALSNQAYRDSGVYIDLRLVHKQQVEYSDTTSNSTALDALTAGSDPALAGVASLRDTYGADLVSLVRPFNQSTAGGCGVAWVGGYGGQPISSYAGYGYSVVSDGRDVNGSGYYCLDLSFAHELGHNMGSMHDRANAGGGLGAYPYSYGYGIDGTFGTVMSYINPRLGKFSNPAITCVGGIACGISETISNAANNALSLNNTRMAVANFRVAQQTPPPSASYTLTVSKSGSGTVTGTGIDCGGDCTENYAGGTSVTLTATADVGATFAGWSGACTGTANCTLSMTTAKNVTATFTTLPKYTLTVGKSGSGTVTSNPAGINCGSDCSEPYLNGTVVTLSATPASGYTFGGWSGACTGTGNCTVTMSAARSVIATFKAIPKYTLTIYRSGSGTVTSNPAGINCGSDCSEPYLSGTTVALTATPATGYYFSGWSGACTGTANCTVTMSAARSVTATFKH
ncbi:InlB B-repeat-containing protein [Candidatus Competibacter phosphatis]|nr:M12 family metallo-peptidase [Candidatus Competibacter phosphatis]